MSTWPPTWDAAHQKSEEPTRYERKRDAKAVVDKRWRHVCRVVDTRDRRQCRACGRRCYPYATALLDRGERHHIHYRSAGGLNTSANIVLVCGQCHADEHRHQLTIEGNADQGLMFYRRDGAGRWYISRQEIAPHVLVPRD